MHCPQCGQPSSDEVRFCKSCGFSLDRVRELFAPTAGSSMLNKETHKAARSRSRMGLYRGVVILSIGIALLSFGVVRGNLLPLTILIVGLLRLIYAIFFQDDQQRKKKREQSLPDITSQLGAATLRTALPPSQPVPVSLFSTRRIDTAEMLHSPSVTEHTTKLLDDAEGIR